MNIPFGYFAFKFVLHKKHQVFENKVLIFEKHRKAATGWKELNYCYWNLWQIVGNGFSQHIAEFLPMVVKTLYFCVMPVQEKARRKVNELKSSHLNR